jgi:hypothetical protein
MRLAIGGRFDGSITAVCDVRLGLSAFASLVIRYEREPEFSPLEPLGALDQHSAPLDTVFVPDRPESTVLRLASELNLDFRHSTHRIQFAHSSRTTVGRDRLKSGVTESTVPNGATSTMSVRRMDCGCITPQ